MYPPSVTPSIVIVKRRSTSTGEKRSRRGDADFAAPRAALSSSSVPSSSATASAVN